MTTSSIAPAPVDLNSLRAATLTTLVALAEARRLPLPTTVSTDDSRPAGGYLSVTMWMERNDREAVRRWAELLGLPEPEERLIPHRDDPFLSYKSTRGDLAPVWLGWQSVQISAICDLPVGGAL